jgi:hypothetical protein
MNCKKRRKKKTSSNFQICQIRIPLTSLMYHNMRPRITHSVNQNIILLQLILELGQRNQQTKNLFHCTELLDLKIYTKLDFNKSIAIIKRNSSKPRTLRQPRS